MGSLKRKMSDHARYHHHHHQQQQRRISKVLNSVLEQRFSLDERIRASKMAIQQEDDRKLEVKPKRCALVNGGGRRRPMIKDQIAVSPDGLPIDLSKRSSKMSDVYVDGSEVMLTDGNHHDGQVLDNLDGQVEVDGADVDDGEEEVIEEPLNLSTNTGKLSNCTRMKSTPLTNKTTSPDLLQKRVRLEEMVSYIRKCSVVDGAKYCLNSPGYPHRSSDASDADSEGDEEDKPMKRSLSCSAVTGAEDTRTTPVHRRKSSVTYRGGGNVLRVTYRNIDAVNHHNHQPPRTYPVLRQQLLRSVSRDEEEEEGQSDVNSDVEDDEELLNESPEDDEVVTPLHCRSSTVTRDNSSNSDAAIVPPPHWSAYAYYANLFQELQSTLPAAAQGLLMTTTTTTNNTNAADDIISKNETVQAQQQHQQQQVSDNSNGAHGAPNALLRKRAPRALTGKHVKHGTGASPATLLTLRQKIEQKRNQQHQQPKSSSKGSNAAQLHHHENGAAANKDGRRGVTKRANKRKGNG